MKSLSFIMRPLLCLSPQSTPRRESSDPMPGVGVRESSPKLVGIRAGSRVKIRRPVSQEISRYSMPVSKVDPIVKTENG